MRRAGLKPAAPLAVAQTGAGTAASDEVDPVAEAAYERIRASTTDVAAVARATGIKAANIQKVKEHTFLRVHLLDRYAAQGVGARRARFQAFAPIAAAGSDWRRARVAAMTYNCCGTRRRGRGSCAVTAQAMTPRTPRPRPAIHGRGNRYAVQSAR